MGCIFIGLGALLVRSLGVLVTGLGMIAGQLLGSLGLDLLVPAPGTVVALPTVLGTLLTLGCHHPGHPALAPGRAEAVAVPVGLEIASLCLALPALFVSPRPATSR